MIITGRVATINMKTGAYPIPRQAPKLKVFVKIITLSCELFTQKARTYIFAWDSNMPLNTSYKRMFTITSFPCSLFNKKFLLSVRLFKNRLRIAHHSSDIVRTQSFIYHGGLYFYKNNFCLRCSTGFSIHI